VAGPEEDFTLRELLERTVVWPLEEMERDDVEPSL
jgi:hypothetical protein